MKVLILVESPAKAKKIKSFLNSNYIVKASFGHIRRLIKNINAIDTESFKMVFENDKSKVIKEIKDIKKRVDEVILASDEDREGEAIAWHLAVVLKLDIRSTKRIVFHEITKKAILKSLENPGVIRMNMVESQLARQTLDHLVGFRWSPLLWKYINGPTGMSAGRVQSVIVKLIMELEEKINNFEEETYYKIDGIFNKVINSLIMKKFKKNDSIEILKKSTESNFTISDINIKKSEYKPPPPYITSTMLQDISRSTGMSSKTIMGIAQKLHENGDITYHRSDSLNLSKEFLKEASVHIDSKYGDKYKKIRQFKSSDGAQEAHEAIRPTNIKNENVKDPSYNKVYKYIYKRALASQMSNKIVNKISLVIKSDNYRYEFISTIEETLFKGFKILYKEEKDNVELIKYYKSLKIGDILKYNKIKSNQSYTSTKDYFSEPTLIKKLDELGIGRPSTLSSLIEKIQAKQYVMKDDIKMKDRVVKNYVLEETIYEEEKLIKGQKKKNKFITTQLGRDKTKFLDSNFKQFMDYNFTGDMENQLDLIAEGKLNRIDMLRNFYKDFFLIYNKLYMEKPNKTNKGRLVGKHPKTGLPIYVRIAKYGPVAQIGDTDAKFVKLNGVNLDTVTLEYILDKEKYPKKVGEYEGNDILLIDAKYGFTLKCNGEFFSLYESEKENLDAIDNELANTIITRKKRQKKPLKILLKGKAKLINGPYGVYLRYNNSNYKIPKTVDIDKIDDKFVRDIIK